MVCAIDPGSRGVMVVFGGHVIAGTRAKKNKTISYDAFASVNFPELALVQGDRLVRYIPSPWPTGPVEFSRTLDSRVFLLKLIPGMSPALIPEIFHLYDCVIVESFGVGGLPGGDDGAMFAAVRDFDARFTARKRERKLLEFSDFEHLALRLLRTPDGTPTPLCENIRQDYAAVMVDEYQDSNLVQEMITNLVSGWADGRKNIFMVGDVKQSIYRFRLARPELFMEKYETYTKEDSPYQKIELHKNFRSREGVLAAVNDIFYKIMGKDLGRVHYDEDAALYPGADYPVLKGAADSVSYTHLRAHET